MKNDKTKDGWIILEDIPRRITVTDLELVSFLKEGESSVNGEEMLRRARFELNANYGQEDAEWLLERQNEIPAEFRSFYLTFTGTVWQDSGGDYYVSCLLWFVERWYLDFTQLDLIGGSDVRLVRPRK